MTEFQSPEEVAEFVLETARELSSAGLESEATILIDWGSQAHTTSSEWLGELGFRLRSIEVAIGKNDELRARIDRLLGAVHKAWPGA